MCLHLHASITAEKHEVEFGGECVFIITTTIIIIITLNNPPPGSAIPSESIPHSLISPGFLRLTDSFTLCSGVGNYELVLTTSLALPPSLLHPFIELLQLSPPVLGLDKLSKFKGRGALNISNHPAMERILSLKWF